MTLRSTWRRIWRSRSNTAHQGERERARRIAKIVNTPHYSQMIDCQVRCKMRYDWSRGLDVPNT